MQLRRKLHFGASGVLSARRDGVVELHGMTNFDNEKMVKCMFRASRDWSLGGWGLVCGLLRQIYLIIVKPLSTVPGFRTRGWAILPMPKFVLGLTLGHLDRLARWCDLPDSSKWRILHSRFGAAPTTPGREFVHSPTPPLSKYPTRRTHMDLPGLRNVALALVNSLVFFGPSWAAPRALETRFPYYHGFC